MTRRALNPDNMTDRNWWSSPRYWVEQAFGAVVIIGGFGLIHSLIFALEGATP